MDEREHEEMRSLIAPYVLGAVPAEEMKRVRSHLLSCDECLSEADQLSPVGDSLAASVEPSEVPAGFAARVMSRVREERSGTEAVPLPATRRAWLPNLAVAAMLLVTAVMGVTLYRTSQDLDVRTEAVRGFLSSDGMRLDGTGARGAMIPTDEGALFVAEGLERLPGDRVYQLWLMKGDCQPGATGSCDIQGIDTFTTDDGVTIVAIDESLEGYSRAAVTVEPEGGSPQPTSDPALDSATA